VAAGVDLDVIFASAVEAEVVTMTPDPPTAGQPLSFVVRVRNRGTIPIGALLVVVVVTVGGDEIRRVDIKDVTTLPPKDSFDRRLTVDVASNATGKPLVISVSVGGVVPFGYPVQARASKSAVVEAGGG
jgi:hypothetical protein